MCNAIVPTEGRTTYIMNLCGITDICKKLDIYVKLQISVLTKIKIKEFIFLKVSATVTLCFPPLIPT